MTRSQEEGQLKKIQVMAYTPSELKRIIKKGEDRKRWGQSNRTKIVGDEKRKYVPHPHNHISRSVWALSESLEMEKMHAMAEGPEEWYRLHGIQLLAREQVKDDMELPAAMRIGRQRVLSLEGDPAGPGLETPMLYKSKTPDQEAMSAAMDQYLFQLTDKQLEAIQEKFYAYRQLKDSLALLGIAKKSWQVRIERALTALRKLLVEDFGDMNGGTQLED